MGKLKVCTCVANIESTGRLTDYYNQFTKIAQSGRPTQKALIIEFFDTLSLALRKNEAYGDTVFEDSCFGQDAGDAIWVRMSDKIARLRRMIATEYGYEKPCEDLNESIEDTLRDLAAYSLLSVILRNLNK